MGSESVVVPGLPPDVAGYLVAEWDLQAAMQRQRAHLQQRRYVTQH